MIKNMENRGICKSKNSLCLSFPEDIRLRAAVQLLITLLLRTGLYLGAFNAEYTATFKEYCDALPRLVLEDGKGLSEDMIKEQLGDLADRTSFAEDVKTISSEATLKYGGKEIPAAVLEFFEDCKNMQEKKRLRCVDHTLQLIEELREELKYIPTVFEPLVGAYVRKIRNFLNDEGTGYSNLMNESFQGRKDEEAKFGPWLANANHIKTLAAMEKAEIERHAKNEEIVKNREEEWSRFLWEVSIEFREKLHTSFVAFMVIIDKLPLPVHFVETYVPEVNRGTERISIKRMLRHGPRGHFLPERVYPGIGKETNGTLKKWTHGVPEEPLETTAETTSHRSQAHKQCAASKNAVYDFWLTELHKVQKALWDILQSISAKEESAHRNFLRVVGQLKQNDD